MAGARRAVPGGMGAARSRFLTLMNESSNSRTGGITAPEGFLNSIDSTADVRTAHGVIDSTQAQSSEQIGQVFGARFNRDHFAHFEVPPADVAHNNAMLGTAINRNNDLCAIRKIARLRVIV